MSGSDLFDKARRAAYKYLTYRSRTEYEIKEKLLKKGFDAETVGQVIGSLREYRMLDDGAYADRYVAGRQNYSRAELSGKLRSLGIRKSVINGALESIDTEAEFRIAVAQVMNRKKRRAEGYTLEKAADFLRRRGFDLEVVDRVCHYLENMHQS